MDKERILAILREHEPELKAAELLHPRLFGSVAATPESDVDLLADLDDSKLLGLIAIVGIENTDLLEAEFHLSLSNSLRALILERVTREAIPAF